MRSPRECVLSKLTNEGPNTRSGRVAEQRSEVGGITPCVGRAV